MARPFRVRYLGTRGDRSSVDISAYVTSVDKWLDVGSGEVAQCQMMLECRDGAFLVNTNSGRTPIISHYDEIEVRIGYNDSGEDTQRRIFYVSRMLPQREGDSVLAQVEMFGREAHLRRSYVGGVHVGDSYRAMLFNLAADYANASHKPLLATALSGVPEWPVGTVDFGDGDTSVYDAAMRVLGRLNLPAAAGGAHDIFSLTFEESSSDDTLTFCVRSQGSRNAASTPLVLDADADADFVRCTQVLEAEEASRVRLRGRQDFGSLPTEFAEWRDALTEWGGYQDHVAGRLYGAGALVRHAGRAWRRRDAAAASVATPPDSATWEEVHVRDLLPAGFNYSPWTNGKAMAWQNMMSNPSNNRARGFDSPAVPDGNLQVRDDTFSRDWVHFGPVGHALDVGTEYGQALGSITSLPDGTRLLLSSTYAGSDPYGNAYANAVAVLVGRRLIVTKAASSALSTQVHARGDEVAVISTGKIWEWQRPRASSDTGPINEARVARQAFPPSNGPLGWRDVTASTLGSECFHRPHNVENVRGFLGRGVYRSASASAANEYANGSGVRLTYTWNLSTEVSAGDGYLVALGDLLGLPVREFLEGVRDLTGANLGLSRSWNQGSAGWWATLFMAPGPPRTQGSMVTRGELWPSDFLNLNNLERGSIESDTAGELGETSGIEFQINFEILSGTSRLLFQGNFPFKIFVYDSEGNVWVKDEVVRFQGEAQEIRAFWSQFRIWRARTPLSISNALTNLTVPERLELEQLNERKIKMITIQYDRSYDEFGRYNVSNLYTEFFQSIFSDAPGTLSFVGTIDALHFLKPPVAVATGQTHWASSPVRDYSEISSVRQLRQVAATELEVAQAGLAAYTITYKGRADIHLDDTILYHDSATVATAQPLPANANQRKLVVTRVLHSVTQGAGWETTITAVDRVGD